MKKSLSLTQKILLGMLLGLIAGIITHFFQDNVYVKLYLINGFYHIGGKIFISLMKMIVVPVVFVSLVCGTASLTSPKTLGRMAGKTISLYILTTAIAITIGLLLANITGIRIDMASVPVINQINTKTPSIIETLINIIPSNPFEAFANGDMLPIILFSMLFGIALALAGNAGKKITQIFNNVNDVIIQLIHMVINLTPYGVFCLIAKLISETGFQAISDLLGYFLVVIASLLIHVILTNSILLKFLARLNPLHFFKKMYSAMLFAFSTSSSNVSIPIVLETVEEKLGVKNSIASFIIPLGATINMDGTAIMQGVATVFIAHSYHIDLSLMNYAIIILTAILASIGTAGIPSVGLIMLVMVLNQVGIPSEGIGYIIGIDRVLDMLRTAVNITGDATVACVVARSEKALDDEVFES